MSGRRINKKKLPLNLLFPCWILIVLKADLPAGSEQSWNVLDKASHLHLPAAARFTSMPNNSW